MPHLFRFDPPDPRSGSIVRPRLLRMMVARWEHRVTAVVGGAGLGKTTLLAQSIAENRLAPRGRDVWLGLQASDADGDGLARDVLAAVDPGGDAPGPASGAGPEPRVVADAVWGRAPQHVCLVLDDVQSLPEGSAGAAWLCDLVELLPSNGHLVLASRSLLPIPVARLATQAGLGRIDGEELRFTDGELAGFAERQDVDPAVLASTGGWPAMAELAASVEADLAGQYLWEEVLRPLGPERRRVLAVLCALGDADDALACAALGEPVDLARELAGVPLVAAGAGGRRKPHALWRNARGLDLGAERDEVLRRAVRHLVAERSYDDAMGLAVEGGLADELTDVLRAACVSGARPTVAELDRWLALSPPGVRSSPAGALALGVRAALAAPAESLAPLRHAAELARRAGDLDAELVAIANLGRVGWWRRDTELVAGLVPRVAELSSSGHPGWASLGAIGQAILADLAGDDATALGELATVVPGALDPGWDATVTWLVADVRFGRGEAAAALAALDSIPPSGDPSFALTVVGQRWMAHWMLGRVDEAVDALAGLIPKVEAAGLGNYTGILVPVVSRLLSHLGEAARAQELLDRAQGLDDVDPVRLAVATASLQLAGGDEEAAAATLRHSLATHPIDRGPSRRTWRLALCLPYVLVPETRRAWDAVDLQGTHDQARRLAATVAAVRHGDGTALQGFDLPATGTVRAGLHHRFVADLAVGLEAANLPEGAALLEALGSVGRAAVRDLASGPTRRTRPAKALLAAVPAPPPAVTDLAVLGPLALRRDGGPVPEMNLRRERLRALLAFLVTRRQTTRKAITAALWPDLDDQAAANNLRVTLTYLLRLLEPWRRTGESPFHVRTGGQQVELVTGPWLRLDVDRFDEHVAAAAHAEADGTPSVALHHNRAAVALYRGDLYADVTEADWNAFERDRYRARFVTAATRAGQLLATHGDIDEADHVARRAIATDPWAEDAYAVLVTTALARNDRTGARQALDHCLAALDDLGVGPSDETQRLRRRLTAA